MNRHDLGIEGLSNLPDIRVMTGLIGNHLPPFGLLLLVLASGSDFGDCADSEFQMGWPAKMLFQSSPDPFFNGLGEHLGMAGLQNQAERIAFPIRQNTVHRHLFGDTGQG